MDEEELCGGVTIYDTQSVSDDPVVYVVAGSHKNCDFFHALLIDVDIFHFHIYITIITDSYGLLNHRSCIHEEQYYH
jgi:hypothetical protein